MKVKLRIKENWFNKNNRNQIKVILSPSKKLRLKFCKVSSERQIK